MIASTISLRKETLARLQQMEICSQILETCLLFLPFLHRRLSYALVMQCIEKNIALWTVTRVNPRC